LRIYANDDLVGVEVGGAVKNVLAIATGVCDGLGLGLNSRAALMTRGLAEIARLGLALGAERQTFMGLAGMGDLILTCTGDLSRNRRVGLALAQNKSLSQILEELGHVAEGVYTAREVDRLARELAVDMPISAAVAAVLDGRLNAAQAVEQLMARDPREELA
jgi:glycerol-3-phosphate dehydrogenase (NAD(P)+)